MPTRTIYAGAGDGFVRRVNSGVESWATLRNSAAGSSAGPTSTADYGVAARKDSYIYRHFLPFDLGSALPAGATITAVDVYVYVTAKASAGGGTTANNSVTVVQATPASDTTLGTADYDKVGSTELVASRSSFSGLTTSAYNVFSLNAAGVALAQTAASGYFKIALRSGYDLDNVAPTPDTAISDYETRYSEYASTTYDPYIVVTFTLNRTTSDAWAWGADSAAVTGRAGNTALGWARTTGDTWAWSDTTSKGTNPRTAGTQRTVFTGGTVGTFGAHYAFPFVVRVSDGRLLAVCRKATSHGSYDGSLVGKHSSDDGASWGTEFTIVDGTVTGYDERDPGLMKLASGRLCLVNGRRKYNAAGDYSGQPQFYYSDDNGATWSSGVSITTGLYGGNAGVDFGEVYASDVVQLHNGDLLCAGYGTHSSSVNHYDLFVSKSTDGGATWSALSTPASYATDSYDAVEPQVDILGTGKLILTYHNADGVPQSGYVRTSTDSGATWSARTLITTTSNRHGLSVMDDGQTAIISFVTSYGAKKFSYIESRDYGATWLSAVEIGDMTASSLFGLWAMSASLAGIGNQQNVGFIYNGETAGQTQASIFYKQFSGMDGVFVYARATADAWAWSDSNARTLTRTRTTGDSWAWSDTATRPVSPRTTSDTWGWASPGAAVRATAGGSGDSWAWSTPVVPATVTEGAGITIHPQGMVPGTAIAAYLRWEWRGPVAAKLNAGPGSAVQETTVGSDLTASFTLAPGEYVAYSPAYPTKRLFFMVTE